ncbi:hypothetical protein PIIN_11135 [Serendipita indica DSM 11827]|uniref:Uncharacterized protein n=1 Tax=Serendipita indica (strain DSM 11827) TaxID=1109443 RepID=G4U0Q9_SERID|nr:hypothetical protein PIIN_11135 [Serendipita indica DSM 11827]
MSFIPNPWTGRESRPRIEP